MDHRLRKFDLSTDSQQSVGRRSDKFQTAHDSYASRMWVVSHRPKNSPTTRLAAGRTLPRLVPNDEGSLRSQIDAEPILSRRYRELYAACDLAFCTSDGMQEMLGPHPNSHVIYPMPGTHRMPEKSWPPLNGKFRLVYVGSVENFYGRMLCSLIEKIEATKRFGNYRGGTKCRLAKANP